MVNIEYDALLINIDAPVDPFLQNELPAPDSIGLDILAACANEKGYKTKICHLQFQDVLFLLKREFMIRKVGLVGFYCHFRNIKEVTALSIFIKKEFKIPILIGGPQTIALDEEFLLTSLADTLVIGEGEETFIELLDYYLSGRGQLDSIKGIAFLDGNKNFIKTHEREPIDNLDKLPFPNDSSRLEKQKRYRFKSILTGRGCPFSCAFCFEAINTKKVRYRSIDNVMAEIKNYLETLEEGQRSFIYFTDDTFTLDSKRVLAFCKELSKLREKYDFMWFCEGHVNTIAQNPHIIEAMVKAGLGRLQIGLESGVQDILDAYNKKITLQEFEKVINLCSKYFVPQVCCNIIVGGALETQETIETSTKFALRLFEIGRGMLEINLNYFVPYPNTAMTLNPEKYSLKILECHNETSIFSSDYPVVETHALKRNEIHNLKLQMAEKFFKKMFSLKDSIDLHQVLACFKVSLLYGKQGEWYRVLTLADEHKRLYFSRQVYCSEIMVRLESIAIEPEISDAQYFKLFLSLTPLRTISLPQHTTISNEKDSEEYFSIHAYNLSSLESEIIKYCAGQLKISEIIELIAPTFSGKITQEKFLLRIKEIFESFERRYWVTFSKELCLIEKQGGK